MLGQRLDSRSVAPAGRSITGEDLVAELGRIVEDRGSWPAAVRCDNGPELICAALADWCGGPGRDRRHRPRCPWQNPWIESFNGRLRDECLDLNHVALLLEPRVVIEDW